MALSAAPVLSGQRLYRRELFRAFQRPPDGEKQNALRQCGARKRRQKFKPSRTSALPRRLHSISSLPH